MDTNPLYSSDTWQRIYQYYLNRGHSPVDAERMATTEARNVVASDAASQRALEAAKTLPDSALQPTSPENKYSGMTPAEEQAARAQDLATYKFWQNLQGAPETPRADRRPSFQTMQGLAARAQAIDPEKAAEAQRLADIARQKIEASTMRPSGYEPASDPGRTDYNRLYADLDRARGATPETPAAAPVASYGSARVPEILAPMEGQKDERLSPPAPIPTPVKSLIARAQNVVTNQSANRPSGNAPQQAPAPQAQQPWYSRPFSGPDVQSTGQQVVQRMQGPMPQGQDRPTTKLNWGDSDSAADFFRADKARQEMEKSGEAFSGMKRGGTANGGGKDAALHKALEIIHHMLTRGR